jgi:hypothetical protein
VGEYHDQVFHDTNKLQLKEVEALTRMALQRLQRKRLRDKDDEDYEAE